MNVTLTVNQDVQGLFCILSFQNNSPSPFFLNKYKVGLAGEISSKLFIVKHGNAEVPYIGMMKKRSKPTSDDFIKLLPSENLKASIQIDKAYKFDKGLNKYTVQYSSYHSSPEENPKLNKLISEVVSFEYNNF